MRLTRVRSWIRAKVPERYRRRSLHNPALAGVLTISLILSLVFLLTPDRAPSELDAEMNGVARRDYRAPRTFTQHVADPAAEARAREAETRVPRVYRYDAGIAQARSQSLRELFDTLRPICLKERRSLEALIGPDGTPGLRTGKPARDREECAADPLAQARAEALQRLGPDVDPRSLDALFDVCFPSELADEGGRLLEKALGRYIVAEKAELLTELDRGIYIIGAGEQPDVVHQVGEIASRNSVGRRLALETHRLFAMRQTPEFFNDAAVRAAFLDVVASMVTPTIRYDRAATHKARSEARRAVQTKRMIRYQADEVIVRKGEVVTPQLFAVLQSMYSLQSRGNYYRGLAGVTLVVSFFLLVIFTFGTRHVAGFSRRGKDLVLAGVVLVMHVALIRISIGVTDAVVAAWDTIPAIAFYLSFPWAIGAMFLRLFVGPTASVLYALILAAAVGILIDSAAVPQLSGSAALYVVVLALVDSLLGAAWMATIRKRAAFFTAGLVLGGVNLLMALGFCLLDPAALTLDTAAIVTGAAASGITSAVLVSALVPAFEWAFGYTTDIKLLELSSLNQPILKRLILEAPGTYHHSFLVGNLVESAAESIGANPLLARTAALYHDLGKLKNPLYFAENQRRGQNRHDRLQPTMSALILKAHLKDSVRIAAENGLTRDICDIIEQHHGTTLIQFFYRKALESSSDTKPPPSESEFRYPGPKPQTREAALVMLADSAEAAVRSLPEKSPSRIQGVVHKIVLDKFLDGQLAECDLTLRDLNEIEQIFTTVLQGIHHARPEYPGGRTKSGTRPRLVALDTPSDGVRTLTKASG